MNVRPIETLTKEELIEQLILEREGREDDRQKIYDAALEAAAVAVSQHDKAGREWVKGSLFDALSKEASARIRALKNKTDHCEDILHMVPEGWQLVPFAPTPEMTDRELLELAAKAAGVNLQWMGDWPVELRCGIITAWSPLEDNGDAFRLAVDLGLRIEQIYTNGPRVMVGNGDHWANIPYSGDRRASTRRAIVRAAAEIGKEMK